MILRPYGVVIAGELELGLELVLDGSRIAEVRPHTGIPERYVVSPAFVNAHSHLEYRGFLDKIDEPEYWGWIRELTSRKAHQTADEVRKDCRVAALENVATGVALIAEHSDRPFAGGAMRAAGIGGVIFQEVITFNERLAPAEKLTRVRENADQNRLSSSLSVWLTPHAYHTVDRQTLSELGDTGCPLSVHVAETEHESAFTRNGSGPIGEFYRQENVPFEPSGESILRTVAALGLLRPRSQLVHCCALEDGDIELIVRAGVSVAHCPRSNTRLKCPTAPIRELMDAGVPIGLGLDSAASSGPIDMFAEMREALRVSALRGRPLTPEEVWLTATGMGYASVAPLLGDEGASIWDIAVGSSAQLTRINLPDASSTDDLIQGAGPELVEWLSPQLQAAEV